MSQKFGRRIVKSLKNQALIADKCFVAERFLDRLRGLIGMTVLEPGFGMLFPKCNDIHMWFMSLPIDVVFLRRNVSAKDDSSWIVTSVHRNVRPWKVLPLRDSRASETLELPIGTIDRCSVMPGDELCINSSS